MLGTKNRNYARTTVGSRKEWLSVTNDKKIAVIPTRLLEKFYWVSAEGRDP